MSDDTKLGCRSRSVLHKLGHDLRETYADTLQAPIPPRLADLARELSGEAEWRDVGGNEPGRSEGVRSGWSSH